MKVKWYDKKILKETLNFALFVGSILGIIALFDNAIIPDNRTQALVISLISIIFYYIIHLVKANVLKCISLDIMSSTFIIKEGDIFEHNSDELNVINFNEYFDTCVDNRIIAEKSLNGKFIQKYVKDINDLDCVIEQELKEIEVVENRKTGKQKRYELGEIVEYKGFLLTSLTKFDKDNRAYISLKDYLSFLMNFWNNLDKIYANRNVNITLFGSSSLTRFTDAYEINDQDLIEIIIWSFKISKIKFKYPTKITLVLSKDLLSKINLYKIKEMYKSGI